MTAHSDSPLLESQLRISLVPWVLVVALALSRTSAAQEAEEDEAGEGDVELETGQGEQGEYQLRGPGDVATPEELFGTGGDSAEPGGDGAEPDSATPEDELSLDLDIEGEGEAEAEGGTGSRELPPVHPVESIEEARLRWFFVGPYYQGIRGEEGVRLFFPVYFQRWTLDGRRELAVLPFYWRSRGPAQGQGTDVAFPFVWSYRRPDSRTLVIANVYRHRGASSAHTGVAPLAFWGHTAELSYQVGFPLFWRFDWTGDDRSFLLAGLWFDHQTGEGAYRRGLFPLVWIGERQGRGYGLGLPLVYHFWNNETGRTTTVVPPVAVRTYTDGYAFSLAPVLFFRHQETSSDLTLFPLFYYGWNDSGRRTFVSPLAWYHGRTGVRMGGALLYHFARRPHSRFDGFIPFYLRGSDSQLGTSWQYIFPIIYSSADPVRRRTVLFPVVWDFENRHVRRTTAVMPLMLHTRRLDIRQHTTWVVPTFQYSVRPDGWSFNFHPIAYFNRTGDRSHQVVAPLFWRFAAPESTSTIFFPFYWSFARGDSTTSIFFPLVFRGTSPDRTWTAVLNTVYTSGNHGGVPYWSFSFFPFFRVARPAPGDLEWDILLGLTGYGRRGDRRWVDVFWVPVELAPRATEATIATLGDEQAF